MRTRRLVLGIGVGLYLVGFGMLSGMVVERMRFDDKRSEVLARFESGLAQLNARRMALERLTGAER